MKNQNKLIALQKILTSTKQPANTHQIITNTKIYYEKILPILETLYNKEYLNKTPPTKPHEKTKYTLTKKGKQLLTNIEEILPIATDLWDKLPK